MMVIKRIFILSFGIFLYSCTGTIEKTWIVTDFSKPHVFEIKIPENKDVTNANIYLSGNFSGTIYLSKIKNDSTMRYTEETLPKERVFTDFYGGNFIFHLAPSNATGKLNVTVKIPYTRSFYNAIE